MDKFLSPYGGMVACQDSEKCEIDPKSRFYFVFTRYLAMHSTFATKIACIGKNGRMNLENTQVQMRKGILEYCILHIISRGEVYASDMLDELTAARIIVVEGTLYPLLTRLKNAGFLEYKWVESKSGPPRKYYKLTDKGSKFLGILTETWDDLVHSTQMITSKPNA